MTNILRLWWPILIAVTLLQAGNGLTGTLISVTSEARAFAPWLQGSILSAFYVGSLIGALAAPMAIARSSHIASFAGFTLLLVAATAGYALTELPVAWVGLRLMAGFGISGMFATVESWLNLGTQDSWRARVFSIYIMVQLGGLAAGQLFLNARGWGNEMLFLCATFLSLLGLACVRLETVQNPKFEGTERIALGEVARRAPLGVAAVALSGFAWAGVMASGPALVEMIGLGDFAKSIFMVTLIVSGMAAQFPIGYAADHADRRVVLAGMGAAAAVGALFGLIGTEIWVLLAFAVVFGSATFPLYAVGVARVSEQLRQSERTAASAAMIVFFQIGAIVAPPILAYGVAIFGSGAYFAIQALPQLLMAVVAFAAYRRAVVQSS